MKKHGKRHEAATALVDKTKSYPPGEALALAKQCAYAKFDETVELHLTMGVDPKHADQQVRGVATLPHGLGKQVRVLVFAQGDAARAAQSAGADRVGADELIKEIEGGWLEFDIALATPDMMGRIGRLGRILGRRGLMPNPKSGTVVQPQDIPRAIEEARKGRLEFRLDKGGVIHVPIGKASFEDAKLTANMVALLEAIIKARPSGAKGQYIRSAYLTTTMGPGIRLHLPEMTAIRGEGA